MPQSESTGNPWMHKVRFREAKPPATVYDILSSFCFSTHSSSSTWFDLEFGIACRRIDGSFPAMPDVCPHCK